MGVSIWTGFQRANIEFRFALRGDAEAYYSDVNPIPFL
jgi:hypothetical protein